MIILSYMARILKLNFVIQAMTFITDYYRSSELGTKEVFFRCFPYSDVHNSVPTVFLIADTILCTLKAMIL